MSKANQNLGWDGGKVGVLNLSQFSIFILRLSLQKKFGDD